MASQVGAVSRRQILGMGGLGAAAVVLGTGVLGGESASAFTVKKGNPFTLGVASGDPASDGFVLWTRLAPDPFAVDGKGGMPAKRVRVEYEVATDERFRHIVRHGAAVATPELGHSVHPEIHGLAPGHEYFYRFRANGEISPIGRSKTMPSAGSNPRELDFAFASCQAWQDGYFTAYDHMAAEDLDLVVHLGDYLYEYELTTNKRGVTVPEQFHTETFDLARYRLQYSLYKSEAPLQKAHASFPFIHTLDDHEVVNEWADDTVIAGRNPNPDPAAFAQRKAAAFQAFYENLPLRRAQLPSGPHIRLHRRLAYGRLADFVMIDTRGSRDIQACSYGNGTGRSTACTERFDTDRTILGPDQRRWLLDGLSSSRARWQVLGNQVPMLETDWDPGAGKDVWLDPWDGYVADRNKILAGAQDRDVRNLVVITGDRHQNYAADLKRDFDDPGSPTVAGEFVGTSITSGADGADIDALGQTFLAANPHMKFYNAQRGYVRVNVNRERWRSDFRVLPYVTRPGAPISTRASFVVEDRRPGVQPA
ncbi:alkaline phosphatase D family protein [Actinomadura sp. HBU206391]|uniref:alkaline phosphatase D family protein n=1 Tax=Actinomadura sp. HBU206391 TaxID=2731692 RepID=UPI0016504EB5|nr:alkaline phosphatase D family protein [Actinomadura sp. HBU206391]MBC6457005.1 alkaline phosphatase D family protein [Actinomadura sp. HBU206391]